MISPALYSSRSEEWGTPQDLFNKLNSEFNFSLDVCATPNNAKCKNFITKNEDALMLPWDNNRCFMNPPYGKNIGQWMKKAYYESMKGCLVVCLVHARTDTKWFHEWVYGKTEIRYIRGRLKFTGGPNYGSPFPSMIVIYWPYGKK